MFVALLDTAVLWPDLQRDCLLSLAADGVYRAIWSEAIIDEIHYTQVDKHIRHGFTHVQAEEKADHLITQMRTHFPDSSIQGWEHLEGTFGLSDPNDEHVLAAAVLGQAGVIVTNDRGFTEDDIPEGLDVQTPAEFVAYAVDLSPRRALRVLEDMCSRYTNPSHTRDEILDILENRYQMSEAVDLLRSAARD